MRWWALAAALCALAPAARACECCARNATAAECGPEARLEARTDCACCAVCAVQKGGRCDGSARPCQAGLECSSQGVCTDEKKCRSDGECASDRFCLGGVCFDPCSLLDPCNSSLKNGVCRTRNHRPVCSCPQGYTFQADANACVKVGCEDEEGVTVDVGERIFRKNCEETCVCSPGGKFNCTKTACPPGFYKPGTFSNDSECTELRGSAIAGGCCVNVVCSNSETATVEAEASTATGRDANAVTTTARAACAYVVCGPGAFCDAGLCTCSPGLSGDPNDLAVGCSAADGALPTTEALETTTVVPTTSTSTASTTTTAFAKNFDMLPLDITHNTTTLQLPSVGGKLTYSADGRPPKMIKVKKGQQVKTVEGLQPGTNYVFTWEGSDGKKTLRVDTRPGCVTNTSSHAIGETYHMGCQSTCVCGGPNQPSCRPRCSFTRGTVTDKSCSERPDIDDPECCVQLVCAVTSTGGQIVDDLLESITPTGATTVAPSETTAAATTPTTTTTTAASTTTTAASTSTAAPAGGPSAGALTADAQPKPTLIVTTKSFNSATLAWDDFKPQAYASGYVAQYRRVRDDQWRRQELPPQPGQSVPLMKIGGLLPATEYEARVSIYDSRELGTLGDATETIRFTTDDGCVNGNETYPVGGRFYKGCEQTCFCELRGRTRCVPRCQRPLFRRGSFSDDPLCFEKRMDECCVIAACASAPPDDTAVDADGGDPCQTTSCGENYVCELMQKEDGGADAMKFAMCVCPPGFREMTSADGKACVPEVKPTTSSPRVSGCTYRNSTYEPGDEFFDGCEFKCMCTKEKEIDCQARCSAQPSAESSLASGCRLVPDPADDCCQTLLCEKQQSDTTASPATNGTGCEDGGKEYAVNSTFYRGCESRCRCLDGGEISCTPRCAPQESPVNASCTSQPDPDDACCTVPVCATTTAAPGPATETTTTDPATETTTSADTETTTEAGAETTTETATEPATEPTQTLTSRLGAGRRDDASPALRVVELQPVGGDASRLKLRIADRVLDSILSAQTQPLTVQWRRGGGAWQSRTVVVDDVSVESLDTLVMTVPGLAEPRAVDVRVRYDGETSATVRGADVVPADAADAAAEGSTTAAPADVPTPADACVHENYTHAPGQVFFKGCLERCVCFPGGRVACVPRCPPPDLLARPGRRCIMVRDERDPCCWKQRCLSDLQHNLLAEDLTRSTTETAAAGSDGGATEPTLTTTAPTETTEEAAAAATTVGQPEEASSVGATEPASSEEPTTPPPGVESVTGVTEGVPLRSETAPTEITTTGVTEAPETSTFASTLVSQVPTRPPTLAVGDASEEARSDGPGSGTSTVRPEVASEEVSTTTEHSNVIEINFTGLSGQLDLDDLQFLNRAIAAAVTESEMTTALPAQTTSEGVTATDSPATTPSGDSETTELPAPTTSEGSETTGPPALTVSEGGATTLPPEPLTTEASVTPDFGVLASSEGSSTSYLPTPTPSSEDFFATASSMVPVDVTEEGFTVSPTSVRNEVDMSGAEKASLELLKSRDGFVVEESSTEGSVSAGDPSTTTVSDASPTVLVMSDSSEGLVIDPEESTISPINSMPSTVRPTVESQGTEVGDIITTASSVPEAGMDKTTAASGIEATTEPDVKVVTKSSVNPTTEPAAEVVTGSSVGAAPSARLEAGTTTTLRTIPTTRRITGLITGVPDEPPPPTTGAPTEPPRAGGLVPSVGIVAEKKIPTLLRVMTVRTSATVAADVEPLPAGAASPATDGLLSATGRSSAAADGASSPTDEAGAGQPEPDGIQLSGLEPALFSTGLGQPGGREEEAGATTAPPPITTLAPAGGPCVHNGTTYQPGDEFHDGCRQFCMCSERGVMCAPIRCPHRFGLSLLNPDCLEWDVRRDREARPPNCCPEVSCKDDGSCTFEGEKFRNQQEIPQRLSGCERRCYCEFGNVTCQPDCPPVPAEPPAALPCSPALAVLVPGPNGCCKFWQCDALEATTEFFPAGTGPSDAPSESVLEDLEVHPVDPMSVALNFSIPSRLLGLPGKTEVLYTSNVRDSGDLSSWDRRVFETPSGLMDMADYSWTLGDLTPDSQYLLQAKVVLDEVSTVMQSEIKEFSTPPLPTPGTTLPPKVALDAELVASEINTTWAKIGWRRLTEDELRYIDGIQLRYRDVDVDAQVWTMTPFIHRELTTYELTGLKPGTGYEVDIVLMPFQNQNTEMVSERPLRIRTPSVVDLYNFNVTLLLSEVSASSVRVEWSGIPQPQYKYVNVYRIVYIYEKEREEKHTFKLAKTSDQPSLLLKGLKPSSKYQVWLEAYLKNGKKRVSEVQEFVTKPGELGKAESIRGENSEPGDGQEVHTSYFSGMVAAAIVAAIAILLCLIVAFLLVRKSSRAKAPITTARKNGPSYENPAFKTSELDLNGSNGNDRFA